jgi:hypothetical protein
LDELTNNRYLVDTGAALSLIPFNSTSPPSGPTIVNANGKPIPSWNFISQNVHFHNNHFSHSFFQEKVTQPILGFDFLNANTAIIDSKSCQVSFPPTPVPPTPVPPSLPTPPIPTSSSPSPPIVSSLSSGHSSHS